MNNIIKSLFALVVGLGIVGGVYVLNHAPTDAPSVGAISGPNIPYSYLQWGAGFGVTKNPTSYPLTTGTTTPCAIPSPAATSTLRSAGITETVSSTTASRIVIAKAANPYATTTQLAAATRRLYQSSSPRFDPCRHGQVRHEGRRL